MDATIRFTVNGRQRTVTTDAQRPLLEVLWEDLKLTGTKFGCGEGRCGACSALIDGKRAFRCSTPIGEVAGRTVLTIEGLAQGEALHPVQEAFTWAYFRPAAVIDIEASLDARAMTSWHFVNINSGRSAVDTPYRAGHAVRVFTRRRTAGRARTIAGPSSSPRFTPPTCTT